MNHYERLKTTRMVIQRSNTDPSAIPPTSAASRALIFWSVVLSTGVGAGLSARMGSTAVLAATAAVVARGMDARSRKPAAR
jgi:hypothetical protein